MELYLMQHGLAEAAEVDPRRPLTAVGAAEVDSVGRLAGVAGVGLDEIWHSGKLRAQQTAQRLAVAIGGDPLVATRGGLEPDSDPAPIAGWVRGIARPRRVAIVGHLPFLSKLSAVLTGGDPFRGPIGFRNAGLVRMVRGDAGRFEIDWVITPELVAAVTAASSGAGPTS
jgi:phosphohistidine phosphatase